MHVGILDHRVGEQLGRKLLGHLACRCAVGASIWKRIALPTLKPCTSEKPSAGSARSMVAPCGSAIPGRNCTSTSTSNRTQAPYQSDRRRPQMRS